VARDRNGAKLPYPVTGCNLEVGVELDAREALSHGTVAITIYDEMGTRLIDANTLIKGQSVSVPQGGRAAVRFVLHNLRLKPDLYTVGLWLGIQNQGDYDGVRYASAFRIEPNREDIRYSAPFPGFYACEFDAHVESTVATVT
jgi:hypothetical protein